MKKIIIYTFAVLLSVGVFAPSCTGKFEEYNTNQEAPEVGNIDPSTLLEQLISKGAYYIYERSWRVNNELMQYTVDCGNSTRIHRYIFQASEYQTAWNRYQQYAANADHMIGLAEKYEDPNAQAMAMTLKVVFVSLLTDLFGDIPYSEAYRISEGITQPKIDRQADVYKALMALLQEANSLYKTEKDNAGKYKYPITVPGKDLLYGGDVAKWQKFTNSLCLRLCLRLSNRPEMGTAETMQLIVGDPATYPVFGSVADDAKISFSGNGPFKNDFGDMTAGNFTESSHKCSKPFVDQLYSTGDPRFNSWVINPKSDDCYGVESGVVDTQGGGACYMNSAVLKQYTSPCWFMTYSEVQFILAEATHSGLIAGGESLAQQYYEGAITSSILQWNSSVSADNIEKFLHGTGSAVIYNGSLEQIITQKWVSLFMQGFESWCDYRRTGYPVLPIGPDCENESIMPTRMGYPQSLIGTNASNYNRQVEQMHATYPVVGQTKAGGDNMLTPIWWSKRATEMEQGR